MQRERQRGSITVFLAVTFIAIMGLLGTLIDGARLVEAHTQAYNAADLAATSALAGFDYKLKDRYGLFAYQGDPQEVIEYVVKQNLNAMQNSELSASEELYQFVYDAVLAGLGAEDVARNKPFDLLQLKDIKTGQPSIPVTLHNKNEFERQIFEYVKWRGPMELFMGDLTIDFGDIDKELEKAKNEDDADEVIRQLEKELFVHTDMKGKYNNDAVLSANPTNYKGEMAKIANDHYTPILSNLGDTPSISGLGALSGMMGVLSTELSSYSTPASSDLLAQIAALEAKRDQITQSANQLKARFGGGGDSATFDDKPISGEMKENYINDLNDIIAKAQLEWKGGSDTGNEKQKLTTIQSSTGEIQTRISDYQQKIQALQDEYQQLMDRYAAIMAMGPEHEDYADKLSEWQDDKDDFDDKVEALWAELDSHFNGMLYYGGASGVFYNAEELQELAPIEGPKSTDRRDEFKSEGDAASETLKNDNPDSRTFESIPGAYTLPSGIGEADVIAQLSAEIRTDFSSDSWEDTENKRSENKIDVSAIKSLFDGLASFSLNTFDRAFIGLYAMGNFQNALAHNAGRDKPARLSGHEAKVDLEKYTMNMRNDPIESFFYNCEVEYLIRGKRSEKDNYNGIRNELTGMYFIMNYANVRRVNEIKVFVEAIAYAVEIAITAGTLGIGAAAGRAAFYATREALYMAMGIVQTVHDLERLYFGSKVPLLKNVMKDFCGLASWFSSGLCEDTSEIKKLPIGYADYLYIRMITTSHDKLLGRLQDLVEVNMNNGDVSRPMKLEDMRTSATVKTEATMPFFFINVIFMAESFDGTGMKLSKTASQKY